MRVTVCAVLGSQIQLGVPLPAHPTGDLGMIMSLSQTPCATSGACCVNGQCANWAGAHLSSNGCIHVRGPRGATRASMLRRLRNAPPRRCSTRD